MTNKQLVAELQTRANIMQDTPGKRVLRLIGQYLEGKLTRPLAKTKIAKMLCGRLTYTQALAKTERILAVLTEIMDEQGEEQER